MKKKKLIKLPKLLAETQKIVNASIRKRDGLCLRCKENDKIVTTNLNAHHFCVAQGSSSLLRFEPRNLMTLCVGCHRFWYHPAADVVKTLELKHIAIKNGICTEEDIEEMISRRHETKKWTRYELEEIKEKYTDTTQIITNH